MEEKKYQRNNGRKNPLAKERYMSPECKGLLSVTRMNGHVIACHNYRRKSRTFQGCQREKLAAFKGQESDVASTKSNVQISLCIIKVVG